MPNKEGFIILPYIDYIILYHPPESMLPTSSNGPFGRRKSPSHGHHDPRPRRSDGRFNARRFKSNPEP